MTATPAFTERLDALALDVGRLRKRVNEESTAMQAADAIADHIEWLDCLTFPCAAELYATFRDMAENDDEAVNKALNVVERRATKLRNIMGLEER